MFSIHNKTEIISAGFKNQIKRTLYLHVEDKPELHDIDRHIKIHKNTHSPVHLKTQWQTANKIPML
jgi:hypothetical protein